MVHRTDQCMQCNRKPTSGGTPDPRAASSITFKQLVPHSKSFEITIFFVCCAIFISLRLPSSDGVRRRQQLTVPRIALVEIERANIMMVSRTPRVIGSHSVECLPSAINSQLLSYHSLAMEFKWCFSSKSICRINWPTDSARFKTRQTNKFD